MPIGPILTNRNKKRTFSRLNHRSLTKVERIRSTAVQAATQGTTIMIAAFATLVFLATLVALLGIAAAMMEESGTKILAALRGQSVSAQPVQPALRVTSRARVRRPMCARPQLRVAA